MKKFIALLLSVSLMVCFSAVPASAEDVPDASGNMTVSYSVQSAYLVNLPDITLTDSSNTFDITADYVNIEQTKTLQVVIDCAQSLTDGKFMLYANKGLPTEASMECVVYISNCDSTSSTIPSYLSAKTYQLLANFKAGYTTPTDLGRMTFTPVKGSSTKPGNYMGNIYYIIKIV